MTCHPNGYDYTGFAGYVKYQFTPKTAFAGRYEFLNDHDGLAFGAGGSPSVLHNHPQEFTATAEHVFANHLISRLEYRYDYSNQNIYQYGSGYHEEGVPNAVGSQNTVDIGSDVRASAGTVRPNQAANSRPPLAPDVG